MDLQEIDEYQCKQIDAFPVRGTVLYSATWKNRFQIALLFIAKLVDKIKYN